MPLPTKSEVKDYDDCVSKVYTIEKNAGKGKEQARAIALNHCGSMFGKDNKNEMINMEFEEIKNEINNNIKELKRLREQLLEEKKWMQKSVDKGDEGKFTEWCKRHDHSGVTQACINEAAKEGGHAAKMASYAVNTNPNKWNYPKKKND